MKMLYILIYFKSQITTFVGQVLTIDGLTKLSVM